MALGLGGKGSMAALWFMLPLKGLALETVLHDVRTGSLCHEGRLHVCGRVDVF